MSTRNLPEVLGAYDAEQYNVLMPSITEPGYAHKLSVEVVTIDPNPENKEVYQEKDGRLALTRVGVDRVCHAAGISVASRRMDDRSSPRRWEYLARGVMKKSDGTLRIVECAKEIDLDAVEEEVRANAPKRANAFERELKKNDKGSLPSWYVRETWIEEKVRDEMIQWRKHAAARCETGARLRVVRCLLALKPTYSVTDLKKPFVIPRIDFAPDISDPSVRRVLLESGARAVSELYGTPISFSAGAEVEGEETAGERGPLLAGGTQGHSPTSADDAETPSEAQEVQGVEKIGEATFDVRAFRDMTNEERVGVLITVAAAKKIPKGEGALADATLTEQIQMMRFLLEQPDPEGEMKQRKLAFG